MTCHSQVWRDTPMLAPVRESWTSGRPLHWQRVHNLPDYVYFDHSIHVQKGVACVNCHGRVDRMPLMAKSETLYMRWCLGCHRDPQSHQGAVADVTAMKDVVPVSEHVLGAHSKTQRLEDCSICHR